jgi:hypothetical protein
MGIAIDGDEISVQGIYVIFKLFLYILNMIFDVLFFVIIIFQEIFNYETIKSNGEFQLSFEMSINVKSNFDLMESLIWL